MNNISNNVLTVLFVAALIFALIGYLSVTTLLGQQKVPVAEPRDTASGHVTVNVVGPPEPPVMRSPEAIGEVTVNVVES